VGEAAGTSVANAASYRIDHPPVDLAEHVHRAAGTIEAVEPFEVDSSNGMNIARRPAAGP